MQMELISTALFFEAFTWEFLQVVRIMAEELGWSSAEQRAQLERARQFIDLEMGQLAKQNAACNVSLNLTRLVEVFCGSVLGAIQRHLCLLQHGLCTALSSNDCLSFSEEMQAAKDRFNKLDKDKKGHITVNDLRRHFRVSFWNFCIDSVLNYLFFLICHDFQEHNQKIDERVLHELLNEVDLNKNGEIEIAEFFQVMEI